MEPERRRTLPPLLALILTICLLVATPGGALAAAKPGAHWKYTALGDSLATGVLSFQGYVPRYRDGITVDTGIGVNLANYGQNGWTSADLLNALRTNRTFRRSVKGSQVVTWNIGGNDLREARESYKAGTCGDRTPGDGVSDNQRCLWETAATFKANWDAIATEILSLRSTGSTIIRTMDIYNPYVDEDKTADSWGADGGLNDFQAFKPVVDDVNAYIATTSTKHGIPYAAVYLKFNGASGDEDPFDKGYITFDGLHPNDFGHAVIANLLRGLGYAPLR